MFSTNALENKKPDKKDPEQRISLSKILIQGKKYRSSKKVSKDMIIINAMRVGIDYSRYKIVIDKLPFNKKELSKFLHISIKTLENKEKDQKAFSPDSSERLLELTSVYDYGVEVFGNKEKFEIWLTRESLALGGITPKELLDTTYGIGLVKDELGRIDYGIFA